MPLPEHNSGFIQWAIGIVVTIYLATMAWIGSKFKEKVSKDVFDVTVRATDDKLERLEETTDKIWEKIDKL